MPTFSVGNTLTMNECLMQPDFKTAELGDALPRQLPEREEDGEFVVELLELIESAEDKLGLVLTFPQEPHHIRLHREDRQGDVRCQCFLQFTSRGVMEHGHDAVELT